MIAAADALYSLVATDATTDSIEGATYAAEVAESDSDNGNFSVDVRAGSLEEMCERALEAAVTHVPTLGWSRDSLEVACMELNLPPGLHSIAMPRGPIDLVLHFYESRNHNLADVLAKWRKEDVVDGKKYIIAKPNRSVSIVHILRIYFFNVHTYFTTLDLPFIQIPSFQSNYAFVESLRHPFPHGELSSGRFRSDYEAICWINLNVRFLAHSLLLNWFTILWMKKMFTEELSHFFNKHGFRPVD